MSKAQSTEGSSRFLADLRAGLQRCGATGASLLVAVSGGADSVSLLCGLFDLQPALNLTLRAAHLNHSLRGAAADADAEWVRAWCQRCGVPCDIETAPIRELAEQSRRGIEETARDARYRFLQAVAQRHHCDAVAVAHTADDQAETVLHHILRGTGLTGLRGMEWSRTLNETVTDKPAPEAIARPPSGLRLIRPMLAIWRTDLERFLAERPQEFRQDASNQDLTLTRNRLRHELLPGLERDFNPRVRKHLCQLAEQAGECDEILRIAADALLQAVLLDQSDHVVRLRCDEFSRASRSLVRAVFVRLWQRQQWPRLAMTFSHFDRLAETVHSELPTTFHLPGPLFVTRRGNVLMLERSPPATPNGDGSTRT
ncbi:MAG: tRNA lysidine(34) synthetase TilS [Planctomycetaceae bacterium]